MEGEDREMEQSESEEIERSDDEEFEQSEYEENNESDKENAHDPNSMSLIYHHDQLLLPESPERIEVSDEPIDVSDEQIDASDEQIDASNEQFVANDEQIDANHEQIDESDEQFEASNEQFEASNEQIDASGEESDDQVERTLTVTYTCAKTSEEIPTATIIFKKEDDVDQFLPFVAAILRSMQNERIRTRLMDYISHILINAKTVEIQNRGPPRL